MFYGYQDNEIEIITNIFFKTQSLNFRRHLSNQSGVEVEVVEALEGIGNTPAHTNHATEIASENILHKSIVNHLIVDMDKE